VADLRPDAELPDAVIVGAHLDSFHDVVGAFDNLTGVATVLEIARLLAPHRPSFCRTLRLVFYTGEETGFVGSRAYVRAHASELTSTGFVLNLDSLCAATARGTAVMLSPGMRDYVARAFADLACSVEVRDAFCMSSDYMAYMVQGIPAARPADFENAFPIWSHTALDDLAHVETDWVVANARVYAKLLAYLLTDPGPLPAQRLDRDRVRQILDAEGATDSFRSFGFDV
jgi:Zn-dependent M28 family amino/carboxypeptidase